MTSHSISRDQAEQAWQAYVEHGNKSKAAKDLGIPRSTFNNRLERGTALYGVGGGIAQPVEPGQVIKGMSTLFDGDGKKLLEWIKTTTDQSVEGLRDALHDVFSEYKGRAELAPFPRQADAKLLTVYPVTDHHLGLYSWAGETGTDYDLDIGTKLLRDTMGQLVAVAPSSKTAIILGMGDFFHADTSANTTAKSGNPLDVDSRYAKVIRAGVEVLIDCIEMAAAKHQNVIVRILPGNHDEHSALMLSVALSMFFAKSKRINIDENPSRFFAYNHGQTFLAATHGDLVKLKDLPSAMASMWPELWGSTKHRYGLTGHVHHNSKTKIETGGAQCESLQSLVAKDAWHHASGYVAGRSMVAITYHSDTGEKLRSTVAV